MSENEELMNAIKDIPFNKYPAHYPYMGLDILERNGIKNITLIEGGGGGSTKVLLKHIAKHGGHVITFDLCTPPLQKEFINGEFAGLSGAGDYSSKETLYKILTTNEIISKHFTYHKKDIYEFFKNEFSGKIDFYFDDAVHDTRYLIPLFELIIPMCNPGAFLGTHDKDEKEMKEFTNWLINHPQVDEVYNTDGQSVVVRLKK